MFRLVAKVMAYLFLGFLVTTHLAWADWRYEQTTTNEYVVGKGKKLNEVSHQKIYVQGKKVRIENQESGKVILIRFDKETLYDLDTKKLTYSEKNFQALKTIQGQEVMQSQQAAPQRNIGMEAARKQLGKMGEELSPERRTFMEQMMMRQQARMMGNNTSQSTSEQHEVVVKETNKSKEINGFNCRRIKVVRGKKKIIDAWITTQAGPKNYFSQIMGTLGLFKPEVVTAVKKIEGFPIKQKYRVQTGEFADALQTVEVAKIEGNPLPAALFELPKGYKKATEEGSDAFADEDEEESF